MLFIDFSLFFSIVSRHFHEIQKSLSFEKHDNNTILPTIISLGYVAPSFINFKIEDSILCIVYLFGLI